jgi:cytochrome c2
LPRRWEWRTQDLAAGEQSFRNAACHAVGEDAKNKVRPVLNGLDGHKSGTVRNTATATPTKADITWAKRLRLYQNPMAKVPALRMAFAGIERQGNRRPVGLSEAVQGRRQQIISYSVAIKSAHDCARNWLWGVIGDTLARHHPGRM